MTGEASDRATVEQVLAPSDCSHAYRRSWRRDGLILRPVGITAEDRFGDVHSDAVRATRERERADQQDGGAT